jgi:sortase A
VRLRLIIPAGAWRGLARSFLLVFAAVCLGLYSYAFIERVAYQTYESREFDRIPGRNAAGPAAADTVMAPAGQPARKAARPARFATPAALIGRLSIPRLNWSAMVREGVSPGALRVAVGHIPATALPGQAGNIGLAGHRDTFFRGLQDVRTNDEIRFSTLNGDFTYAVESLTVVAPEDVAVLAPSSENALTLVTCYPFSYVGSAPKRFVVRARQTPPQTPLPGIVE